MWSVHGVSEDFCLGGSLSGGSLQRVSVSQSLSLVSMSRVISHSRVSVQGGLSMGSLLISVQEGLYQGVPIQGSLSRGSLSGALCLGVSVQGVSVLGSMSRGGDLCPGEGGHCPWGLSLVVSLQEGLYQGVSI